jgi:hypothetical protein
MCPRTNLTPEWGSKTARGGFTEEEVVAQKFNNWKTDSVAKSWLKYMGFESPDNVYAVRLSPRGNKSDVLVTINKFGKTIEKGISIKKYDENANFNQLDKRWVDDYANLLGFSKKVIKGLKMFVGEEGFQPQDVAISNPKEARRLFLNEIPRELKQEIFDFFQKNSKKIVEFLFCGNNIKPDYVIIAKKINSQMTYGICNMDKVVKHYSSFPVELSNRGNLSIGKIGMQRKGGDGGRKTAQMLQFKINPGEIFDIPETLTSQ